MAQLLMQVFDGIDQYMIWWGIGDVTEYQRFWLLGCQQGAEQASPKQYCQ
jgi:hypothetical protein